MTKAKTKAKRRQRARKRQISLSGAQPVERKPTRGPRQAEPPADSVALAARAKRTGCSVEEARDVLAATPMGRCIRYMRPNPQDRRDLLTVWQSISAAWMNYFQRYLGISPTAQAVALTMLPEVMQTDPGLRVDLRTADEKDAAARRMWLEWREAFVALPREQALIIADASCHAGPRLWDADKLRPTRHGALAIAALAALHKARS